MIQRNIHLDYLKLFLSIIVITIHIPLCSDFTINYFTGQGFARVAVPLFFIINGYFLNLDDKKKTIKLFQRLAVLYIFWMLIYLPFYINESGLVFKIIKGYFHLWYLIGLLGAVILLYILKRLNLSNIVILGISLFFFFAGWLIQFLRMNGFELPTELLEKDGGTRNFLFFAFPFVSLGYYIRTLKQDNFIFKRINLYLAISIVLLFIEILFYYFIKNKYGHDFLISTLLVAPILFLVYRDKPKVDLEDDFFAKIFIAIYLVHPLVIFLISTIYPNIENTMRFILVVFFSFILSVNLIQLNRKFKFIL